MASAYKICFYQKPDGTEPVKDFILSLNKKMRAKVLRTIQMLAANGPELREPCSKALEDGIFELRVRTGSDSSRIFYFFVIGQKVILTNGFIKKTQKTPPGEIARAKRYRKDYFKQVENQL